MNQHKVQTVQTFFQLMIAGGLIITATGGFGSYKLMIAGGVITATGGFGSYFIGKKIKYVVVSPNLISVNKKVVKEFILSVTNNLDYSIYDVCLEIRIQKGDLNISDIIIDILDKPIDKQNKSPRYWYINYETKSGKIIKHLFSDYIKAHFSKEFSVKIDCTKCSEKSKISLKVTRWFDSPSKFKVKHNKRSLPEIFKDFFTEDEIDATKEKTSFFMKIKSPDPE